MPDGGQMRYWWVNQNQTYRHEVQGGYLWSPKRNANGARNPFYESMREVAPGDLIFSFMDTRILAIGVAQSFSWECPKPQEFGNAGQNWENIGWKVKVNFTELANKVRLSGCAPPLPATNGHRRNKGRQRGRVHRRAKAIPGISSERRIAPVRPWLVCGAGLARRVSRKR